MNEHCAYPPQPATDLEQAEQQDGTRVVWMAGAASVGRYLMLGATERKVLLLIDGARTPQQICDAFQAQHGGKLSLGTLTKFLTKLNQTGILAGERAAATDEANAAQPYLRFKLFNPDRLFARMVPALRWIWTTEFFIASSALMLLTAWLVASDWAQFSTHATRLLTEHFVAVLLAGTLVVFSHEFAHGLTCKAFGGRATEVGFLLVYYFFPAMYCNVTGIHLIPQRNRRLWVIAAGVYWQLLAGTAGLLVWSIVAPETLLADVALAFALGSLVDVLFNANPLIKLDGYYFLSQWLRMPNLMDRSRAYWRNLFAAAPETKSYTRREKIIFTLYGLLSSLYSFGLMAAIIVYVGGWLMNTFYLFGILLTLGVVLLFARRPLQQLWQRLRSSGPVARAPRRFVAPSFELLLVIVMLAPWRASVGSYGTLVTLPGQEAIIRAPEAGTLVELRTQPGAVVAAGALIGQLGNLETEEQLAQVNTELARVSADYDRLLAESRVHTETVARTSIALRQRQHEFNESQTETDQIHAQIRARYIASEPRAIKAAFTTTVSDAALPPALAALQAEARALQTQLAEAHTQRARARSLHADGILARSELDAAETRAATLVSERDAAELRLAAALTEHRRRHQSTTTGLELAQSDLSVERWQSAKLDSEAQSLRHVMQSLNERQALLTRKRAQFQLTTPRAGAVFGADLPRLVGQYFNKGAELCRVADTRQLLVRIQVPEREIGDVRTGLPVRLKVRAYADQTFQGTVSLIGNESEQDQSGQTVYRVELTVENTDGLLRPGLTAFARIDFGQRMIGAIVWHKLKQTLRPELWML